MIDITMQNFEAEVIEASFKQPVLVDFWATWCGPCKALGPILEKLEGAYEGRFTLAKIDSDAEQQLAAAFGVRSIPTVILMKNGQPADGFVGALPEGQIRQFLDQHLPSADELAAEESTDEAEELIAQGDTGNALDKLREALAINPANDEARFDYVKLLLSEGRLDDARMAFEPLATKSSKAAPVPRIDALGAYLGACMAAPHARAPDALRAAIAANKRDFAARYELAQRLFAAQQFEAALDKLLEILMRDKSWNDGAARRLYVAILELLTPPKRAAKADAAPATTASGIALTGQQAPVHDDPHAAMVADYRRRLSMVLF